MRTGGRERRKYPRVEPTQETVAVFAPTPTLARVRDISLGGLGLEYLEGRPADRDWNEVNLFFAGSRHYLPSLPLKVVYDRGKDEQGLLQTRLHKRFCGVEFGELAPHQATQLQSLITNLAPPV